MPKILLTPGDTNFDLIKVIADTLNKRNKLFNIPQLPEIVWDDVGIPIIDYYSIEKIRACKKDVIIVNMATEGHNLFNQLQKFPTDKKYLLYTNGIWDKQAVQSNIDYEFLHFYLGIALSTRFLSYNFIQTWLPVIPKECNNGKFCALIGMRKPWRNILVSKLLDAGLDNNNFISYQGERLGKYQIKDRYLMEKFDPHIHIAENFNMSFSIPVDIFNQTSFCLVVETNMFGFDEFHLSEKTIKCLFTGFPFIVASSPFFLKKLRQLGFRTYSELWDESYDEIVDVEKRMDVILQLCKELNSRNWEDMRVKLNEIAFHNFKKQMEIPTILETQVTNILETLRGH